MKVAIVNLGQIVSTMGPIPMLALNAGSYGARESATPKGLATGANDAFLFNRQDRTHCQSDQVDGVREMRGLVKIIDAPNQPPFGVAPSAEVFHVEITDG